MRPSRWVRRFALCTLVLGSLLSVTPGGSRAAVLLPPDPLPEAPVDPIDALALLRLQLDLVLDAKRPSVRAAGVRPDHPTSQGFHNRTLRRAGLKTTDDLRDLAAKLRAALDTTATLHDPRAIRPARILDQAQQVAGALYPNLPRNLPYRALPAVLESYAAASDHAAVVEFYDWVTQVESDGTFQPGSFSPGGIDPVVHDPLEPLTFPPGASPLGSSGMLDLDRLLERHEQVRLQARSQLEVAARIVVADLSESRSAALVEVPPANRFLEQWERLSLRRQRALLTAVTQLYKPYRFASRGPDAFDCSGFTAYAWARSGVRLPNYSLDQLRRVEETAESQMLPGDLAFWRRYDSGRDNRVVGHVAIWLGLERFYIDAASFSGRVQTKLLSSHPTAGFGRVPLAEEHRSLDR